MKTTYSYKDIVLQPAYSEIDSRSKLDASVEFLGKVFESVAVPANMKCTIDFKKAKAKKFNEEKIINQIKKLLKIK